MKTPALALALALGTLVPALADAAPKTRTLTKIVGYSAYATWEHTSGDVGTQVAVGVTDNDLSGTGGRSEDAFVALAISQYQISTSNVLISGVAYVFGPENFEFTIDRALGTATLRVRDAIFQDDNSFTFFNVDLDLTWTATGEAYSLKSNDRSKVPGLKYNSHFNGTFRDGVATGSVFGKNIQFTPVDSTSAQLQFNRFGSMEITTGTP